MTDNKSRYEQLCKKEKNIPLFYTYDWFNALYEDSWEVIIEEQGGEIVSFMPFVIQQKKGFQLLLPEPLIPYQGVWMIYPKGLTDTAKLRLEKKVMTNIINQLPQLDYFNQKFHPNFTNWLPFYWRGYSQTTRYTYILPDISDLDKVFSSFKDTTRNKIRKAEKTLHVASSTDIERFHELKLKDCQQKKIKYLTSLNRLKKIMNYSFSTNSGEMLVALDKEGHVHAMLFYIWDKQAAYYLHSVSNPENSAPGAMSLLIWEAIKRSATTSLTFDFEGSMIESIEKYFRSFGGKQTPYFQLSKNNSKLLKLLKRIKNSL